MAAKIVCCAFDKDAIWSRVCHRLTVFLDTNCWINMADEKFPLATQVKHTLQDHVSKGVLFCPLSFGVISELYKQAEDSRLRTGALMEALSLNISYASSMEIFAWELERFVRRAVDAGPLDLSLHELYSPVSGYLASRFHLEFPEALSAEAVDDFTTKVIEKIESLTLTELLKMRARRNGDGIFDFIKQVPAPKYSEKARRIREMVNGDNEKARRIEAEALFHLYIMPAVGRLSHPLRVKFAKHLKAAPKDKYGGFLETMLESLPALHNYVELIATISQNPTRKDKINDFFDLEIMPVPLAYATVFVAQDKGIRDALRNRTEILMRNHCHYCSDLSELEDWLNKACTH